MKRICMYLGFATAILGVIGSFVLAQQLGIQFSGRLSLERNWGLTIAIFLSGLYLFGNVLNAAKIMLHTPVPVGVDVKDLSMCGVLPLGDTPCFFAAIFAPSVLFVVV